MGTKDGNPCDNLLVCLTGEATADELQAFEDHLPACPSCSSQWEELREVWDALPETLELTEPPAGLKEDVMTGIFGARTASADRLSSASGEPSTEEPAKRYKPARTSPDRSGRILGIGVAAASLILAVSIWMYAWREDRTVINALDQPLYVEQTYVLNATDNSMSGAKGTGWIVSQDDKKKLVLNVQGLTKTNDQEAYQVWLIQDGQRKNAGTFRVGSAGSGVLVYELTQASEPFDAIGITLEPDPRGNQPRGKKVLGT